MSIKKHIIDFIRPEHVIGKKLDLLLTMGYFRTGGGMFLTQIQTKKGMLDDVINIRLNLEHHQFSKSIKKIARRVEEKFTYTIQSFSSSPEKEALFIHHNLKFKENINSTLSTLLQGESIYNSQFNTYEVNVYDGDQLIAFSIFDIGKNSLASLLCAYNREYNEYSLGLFTMYAEIQWAKGNHYNYYYPGYILKINKGFDYKLRLGEYQILDWKTSKWVNKENISYTIGNAQKIEESTNYLRLMLESAKIEFVYRYYICYTYGYSYKNQNFLKSPVHIYLPQFSYDEKICIIEYDVEEDVFILSISREDIFSKQQRTSEDINKDPDVEERLLEYLSIEKCVDAKLLVYKIWKKINSPESSI
ncbi:MAG: arginyl-tRNA--protein transferase [Chitinophagales bacterium]|nr:arginyl-tRNA--protein transferase [Chitinophagales bacterium]